MGLEKDIIMSYNIPLDPENESSFGFVQKHLYGFVENILEFDINLCGTFINQLKF